jgi:leucyl-tRNA synthetase
MELANTLQDYIQAGGERDAGWDAAIRTLVLLLNPLAPHLAEELWERLGQTGLVADTTWPKYDVGLTAEPEVTLVVQVAGRVRDRLAVPAGLGEDQALELALASEKVQRTIAGAQPRKIVYVPDRIINLVP